MNIETHPVLDQPSRLSDELKLFASHDKSFIGIRRDNISKKYLCFSDATIIETTLIDNEITDDVMFCPNHSVVRMEQKEHLNVSWNRGPDQR